MNEPLLYKYAIKEDQTLLAGECSCRYNHNHLALIWASNEIGPKIITLAVFTVNPKCA